MGRSLRLCLYCSFGAVGLTGAYPGNRNSCCKVSMTAHLKTTRFGLPTLSPLSHHHTTRHLIPCCLRPLPPFASSLTSLILPLSLTCPPHVSLPYMMDAQVDMAMKNLQLKQMFHLVRFHVQDKCKCILIFFFGLESKVYNPPWKLHCRLTINCRCLL
jgi:hypothetical protein